MVAISLTTKNHYGNQKIVNSNREKRYFIWHVQSSMDWSTTLILWPKFYDRSFFSSLIRWLKLYYFYLLNFNCPTTKKKFLGVIQLNFLITKWLNVVCLNYHTNLQSSNQWQGWYSPLIWQSKLFWSPRKSKYPHNQKKLIASIFLIFQSFQYFPFFVIVSFDID